MGLQGRRGGIGSPFLPFPWQTKLTISTGGGGRSHQTLVASCPDGQRPPSSDCCSQAKLAGEGHELQSTVADSAKTNLEAELSFSSLYSLDSGTLVC